MAKTLQTIKGRIRSISATQKITGAMELVAISKLRKQRNLMEENREYANQLAEIVRDILQNSQQIDNQYLRKSSSDGESVVIVFCSDLGLCGGYNVEVFNKVAECVTDETILLIGSKLYNQLKNEGYSLNEEIIYSDMVDYDYISDMVDHLLYRFVHQEIRSIKVLYTSFVNTMTYVPVFTEVLPVVMEGEGKEEEIIYEPDPDSILDDLVPMYVKSFIYHSWLESVTSEQSSRRVAMESANDNAEKLIEELTLEYNQARQSNITQEITEIIAAADALTEV